MTAIHRALPVLGLLLGLAAATAAREALDHPNLVLIFLDDVGYGDFEHSGNPSIHTPNISRLVDEGMNFPQFYCASPACSASRYALLTGRNPRRSGFGTWVLGPTAEKYIHPSEVTIAEGLRNQGYATGMFGKWHLGNPNANNGDTTNAFPLAHGFDQWLGSNVSNDYSPGAELIESSPAGTNPVVGYETLATNFATDVSVQESLTGRYIDGAIEFIRTHKNQPFFTYVAHNMGHLPVHASEAFQGTSLRGLYGDVMEEIDDGVGKIRAALEEEGIATNTLVIFTSDNGPWILYQNTASHALYGEARILVGSALPFRDGKGSTWEGGVRVPGIFWWPGTIAPASVMQDPASTLDVLPTIFALAGESLPTGRTLDGRDIRPYLNPIAFTGTVASFSFVYTGASDNKVYGIRQGPWKLHTSLYSQTGDDYGFTASAADPLLFNVEQDPHERFDVSASEPGVVSNLLSAIGDFNTSVNTEQTFWGPP